MVSLGADLFLAHPRAAADVVVEASALPVERLGSLAQGEHPLHQGEGAAQQTHIHVGPVKAIQGRAKPPPPGDEDARVGLAPGDAEIGIFLVVFEQHIEVRLVLLDQVGFKRQRLGFTVGDDEFDLAHLAHHQGDARAVAMAATTLEITAHPIAQHLGLADVEDAIAGVAQQIAARLGGHLLEPDLEAFGLLQQGQAQPPYCQPVLPSSRAAPSRCKVAVFTSPTKTVWSPWAT